MSFTSDPSHQSVSDELMLDSPAQTPDAPSQIATLLSAGILGASEVAALIEAESSNSNGAVGGWDTKQWREELHATRNKLQHQSFNPCKDVHPGRRVVAVGYEIYVVLTCARFSLVS